MLRPYLVVVLLLIGLAIAFVFQIKQSTDITEATPKPTPNFVNMYPVADNNFFGFRTEVPPGYYVTSDEMLVRYDSQGGMAPPRLVLMKDFQLLGDQTFYDQLSNPKNTCINIWTTMAFTSIDDWGQAILTFKEKNNKQTITLSNSRIAEIYSATTETGDIYVGFLPINDDKETSYFFNTCSSSNKEDLLRVINSLKFRGDVEF